eukprot:TRINITY_DN35842_c0_g1_i1.p1 TRINITY_DN35842_c0_g1~~TRINITY_DN35842_c0_g1_i1.p1  ORF type:complete len:617 (-),score=132.02 TRINITY_DN35842_c0_g1_i1:305-2155(-)
MGEAQSNEALNSSIPEDATATTQAVVATGTAAGSRVAEAVAAATTAVEATPTSEAPSESRLAREASAVTVTNEEVAESLVEDQDARKQHQPELTETSDDLELVRRKSRKAVSQKWSERQFPTQLFGVIRHTHRADAMGATWRGKDWLASEDFCSHPVDPPLSDEGMIGAEEVANQVAKFVEATEGGQIHVVVSSPYLRCLQTAAAICRHLGKEVRLMVDLGLGEVYGPEVFGDNEPATVIRTPEKLKEHLPGVDIESVFEMSIGRWPTWPESLIGGRTRYAERLLAYLSRGSKARRNFLIVSHADCVGACVALMPSHKGRAVESVGYGGMLLASRAPPPVRKQSFFSSSNGSLDACLSAEEVPPDDQILLQRTDSATSNSRRRLRLLECLSFHRSHGSYSDKDRHKFTEGVLADLKQMPWKVETWDVRLGHRWCNGKDQAVNTAMQALSKHAFKKGPPSQRKIEELLGILSRERLDEVSANPLCAEALGQESKAEFEGRCGRHMRRAGSSISDFSHETYFFGCTNSELGEVLPNSVPNSLPRKGLFRFWQPRSREDSSTPPMRVAPVVEELKSTGMVRHAPVLLQPKIVALSQLGKSTLMQRRGKQDTFGKTKVSI